MIDGKQKIFTTPFVSGRSYRKLLEYDKTIDYTNLTVDNHDELLGFACEVFGNQFTVDDMWDGLPSHEVLGTLVKIFAYVRTGEVPQEEDDQKNE